MDQLKVVATKAIAAATPPGAKPLPPSPPIWDLSDIDGLKKRLKGSVVKGGADGACRYYYIPAASNPIDARANPPKLLVSKDGGESGEWLAAKEVAAPLDQIPVYKRA